jgi:ribonuclease Z
MKVTFLGTTCMQPTVERNHSAILIQRDDQNILFDCGEGTQRQLKIAGIKPTKITKICISHWHGDHVLGLPGLLSTMGANEYQGTIEIYGPKGSKKLFSYMKKAFPSLNAIKYKLTESTNPQTIKINKDITLQTQLLKHSTPCIGFALKENDKRSINKSKLKKLKIPPGPHLAKIHQGKSIKVNNKTITADMISTLSKGKKLAYVPDTRPCKGAQLLAKDADLLIIESTFHSSDIAHAKKHDHMTAKESAQLAQKANVKKLILTHPSLRYKTTTSLLKEAKQHFKPSKNVTFAKDFLVVNV